ncbi:alpha/beta hydrolase [uncultured Shimia sp.]|uniref:alpha/beta hydrolase family protein n=1 Tax=uncultured Shimia sp. TaxID=573152 RepID=UPI0026320DEC|nr:alpha/beta hydrolase [uncultured Shimia sp.]
MIQISKRLLSMIAFLIFTLPAFAQSPGPLQGKVYGSGNRALVVVQHGDVSSGGAANYHYDFARSVARANKNVTVFALLRPGYSDGKGLKSKGSNSGRRDHYTKTNNKLVAQTIQAMAKQVGTSKIIGVGHSGGAAQLGGVLGLAPGLLDSAILVSCPCDIATWRSKRGKSAWPKSASQSPHKQISKIAKGTRITLVVGTNDSNTFPDLSKDYVAAAKARGLSAQYVPVNGAGHGFSGTQSTVRKLVKTEINR